MRRFATTIFHSMLFSTKLMPCQRARRNGRTGILTLVTVCLVRSGNQVFAAVTDKYFSEKLHEKSLLQIIFCNISFMLQKWGWQKNHELPPYSTPTTTRLSTWSTHQNMLGKWYLFLVPIRLSATSVELYMNALMLSSQFCWLFSHSSGQLVADY